MGGRQQAEASSTYSNVDAEGAVSMTGVALVEARLAGGLSKGNPPDCPPPPSAPSWPAQPVGLSVPVVASRWLLPLLELHREQVRLLLPRPLQLLLQLPRRSYC